jgi:hypothetical protein
MNQMDTKENNIQNNQWFWQIILPFILCVLILVFVCVFFTSNSDAGLNLRMVADMSFSFLILLILPWMIISFLIFLFFVFLVNKFIQYSRETFPKLSSIFSRANESARRICESSVRPFFLIEPILSLFYRNKIRGHKNDFRKEK